MMPAKPNSFTNGINSAGVESSVSDNPIRGVRVFRSVAISLSSSRLVSSGDVNEAVPAMDNYIEGIKQDCLCLRANGLAGSLVEVARIEGKIFRTMKEAEAHGLELARQWVDKRWAGL